MAAAKYMGRILLVDDDELVTQFYETFLTTAGFITHISRDLKSTKELF